MQPSELGSHMPWPLHLSTRQRNSQLSPKYVIVSQQTQTPPWSLPWTHCGPEGSDPASDPGSDPGSEPASPTRFSQNAPVHSVGLSHVQPPCALHMPRPLQRSLRQRNSHSSPKKVADGVAPLAPQQTHASPAGLSTPFTQLSPAGASVSSSTGGSTSGISTTGSSSSSGSSTGASPAGSSQNWPAHVCGLKQLQPPAPSHMPRPLHTSLMQYSSQFSPA
mmetsp:Transcript_3971/g.14760  ORF Transcript_3971/g.14760 Transcript_3971/m.14760 type:complete len:220 (-) Transcript_3971:690-1349(-)